MDWLGNAEVGPELRAYAPGLEGVSPRSIYYCGVVWELGSRIGSAHLSGTRGKQSEEVHQSAQGWTSWFVSRWGPMFVLGFSAGVFTFCFCTFALRYVFRSAGNSEK